MGNVKQLDDFFTTAVNDSRIGPAHISLYLALLQWYFSHEGREPLSFYARDIMPMAKLASVTTFHRAIRDLNEYGYIKYIPSFNPRHASVVFLSDQKKSGNHRH